MLFLTCVPPAEVREAVAWGCPARRVAHVCDGRRNEYLLVCSRPGRLSGLQKT